MLSPPQPLDEIQPNLVCGLLHMNGACNSNHFGPTIRARGGVKRSNIIKLQSKIFIPKIVFCLTNKRLKHIKRDCCSSAWVISQRNCGPPESPGGQNIFFEHGHMAFQIDWDGE